MTTPRPPHQELADWRGATLARVRQLIRAADPEIQEEWKWRGTPVWSHDGGVCTGESYKQVVKLTFFRGASLPDPRKLFNASLEGNTRRAIDIREGEQLDEVAFKQLIRSAVTANSAARAQRASPVPGRAARTPAKAAKAAKKLPAHYAVPKADGNDAVQAWIDLLPDWQAACARRLDAVVTRQMPNVHKAVKWHGAWYGVPGKGWFLAVGSFKAHLKLVFFDGDALTPIPPGALATRPQRALDVREADELDEARLGGWVKQARRLPGWGKA